MLQFLRRYKGDLNFISGLIQVIPSTLMFKMGLVSRTYAKEKLLSKFLKGVDINTLKNIGDKWSKNDLPKYINQKIFSEFVDHIEKGDEVAIVSASSGLWINGWAKNWPSVTVISTKLEEVDGKLTGRIDGQNCYGNEKLIRVKQMFDLDSYDKIFVYGNSNGDKMLYEIADEVIHRNKKIR